ncbi:molybdopterin molybdotransferase MoeA [Melioribacter sp. Ez-97]|uniref:molybdopterin molybdotransferase MoeA n=1 Tax=Melioribacter sp. Ez-97 TaxID=3423434 RepID=UPI003EDA3ACD
MLNYNEALEIIKSEIQNLTLKTEEADIFESYNRILAEDVIADVDLPPFDNSAVDGYALVFSERNEWTIKSEVSAGNYSPVSITEDEAVLITTGSKLPVNADTVIPIEDVEVDNGKLSLKPGAFFKKGLNIRRKGSDLEIDKIAVPAFTKIKPKTVAAIASCGRDKVKVFSKLRFAVLATGDELIPVREKPENDKIRVSNIYSLSAAVKEMNHTVLNLGFVKDDKNVIKEKIHSALESNIDFLITTGGVSVGKYDFLKEVFEELGVRRKFWKVNIKPGKPIYFGVFEKNGKKILIFGLPGNPVSSLVNFKVFIEPAIDYLFKQKETEMITAVLQNNLKKRDGKRHFARGILFEENGVWKVTSEFSQSSGNLVEMSASDCLIVLPEEIRNPQKGDIVKCIKI